MAKKMKKIENTEEQKTELITEIKEEKIENLKEESEKETVDKEDIKTDMQNINKNTYLNEIKTKYKKVFIEKKDPGMRIDVKIDRILLKCYESKNGMIDCGIKVSLPVKSIGLIVDLEGNICSVENGCFDVKFINQHKNKKEYKQGELCGYLIIYSVCTPNFIFTKISK